MISGRRSPAEYARRENFTPGKTSSVTHAPPTIARRSRTRIFRPALARYAAATRPLWPPPTMIAAHSAATASRAPETYVALMVRRGLNRVVGARDRNSGDGSSNYKPRRSLRLAMAEKRGGRRKASSGAGILERLSKGV